MAKHTHLKILEDYVTEKEKKMCESVGMNEI